jgi:CBS domain-containing protein
MVVDDIDRLVGMLSMYDILICIQSKNMQVWGEMEDLDPDLAFEDNLNRAKSIQVGDIMTPEVVTISPHIHILAISDLMIKNTSADCRWWKMIKCVGIVYVSDVFYHILNRFLD